MVSIGELNYKIVADTKSFEKGAVATRKELAQAKRAMRDTETATERYGREVDELGTLLKKGAIDQKTYNRAVQQSKTRLDASAKSTKVATTNNKAFTASLKGVAGALIGLQAGRMVLGGITSELQRIDEVAKTSRKLGIMTDELIALRNAAAELSGTSDEVVDKAMQRFTVAISEAAAGTGAASDAIDDLKLSAAQLNAVGPFQAFQLVSEAMKDQELQTDRLRIAYDLFGRGGVDLVNTLNAGQQSLRDYQQAAHDTGQTFTDEMAEGVENANDAVGRLQLSMRNLATEIAIEVAPELQDIADLLTDIADARRSIFGKTGFGLSSHKGSGDVPGFLKYGILGFATGRGAFDLPGAGGLFDKFTAPDRLNKRRGVSIPERDEPQEDPQLAANRRVTEERLRETAEEDQKRKREANDELLKQQREAHQKQNQIAADLQALRVNQAREEKEMAIELQTFRVNKAREELMAFETTVNKASVSFDRLGGTRGSSEEFQALAQIRKGNQERKEQARRDKEADKKRQAFIDRLDRSNQLLDDIKNKPSVTGVG